MAHTVTIHQRSFEQLFSADQLAERTRALAATLDADLQAARARKAAGDSDGAQLPALFIGVLNGAVVFHTDLIRACSTPLEVAYLRTRSYVGMESTGKVEVDWPTDLDVAGRHLVVVEDIVDSGRTLAHLHHLLTSRGAASVRTVVLLDKPTARVVPFEPDYVGFAIGNDFVIGYGLDFDGLGRNLPAIYQLAEGEEEVSH